MPIRFAIRFDNAKNAAMAPMSQMSSSENPCGVNAAKSASTISALLERHLQREGEHRLLPRRDVGLAVIGGDLVRDERVLRVDAQDRAVRDDAVQAVVRAGGRDDDHLALGLGEPALLVHQRVVVGEERAELVGPVRERHEDVRHEAGLLLDREDARADVLRQILELRDRVAADRRRHHCLRRSAERIPTASPRRRRRNAAPSARRATSARVRRRATDGSR